MLEQPFLIQDLPNYSPRFSELIVMMNYARMTTLQAVEGLSQKDLDAHPYGFSNSIGMLLEHMAAVEVWYQIFTFEHRDMNKAEAERWHAGLELGDAGKESIKGKQLDYYLDTLTEVRQKTLAEFAKRDDSWLYESTDWWGNKQANNYFKWFHVFEDEINHRGQIRLLKKGLA
ncbi:MAG: DUF664 domain-containing protein [Trueperaceae bacterium]|nr:DUF664 domain-containing protein [Trueperaceae bacterium]